MELTTQCVICVELAHILIRGKLRRKIERRMIRVACSFGIIHGVDLLDPNSGRIRKEKRTTLRHNTTLTNSRYAAPRRNRSHIYKFSWKF